MFSICRNIYSVTNELKLLFSLIGSCHESLLFPNGLGKCMFGKVYLKVRNRQRIALIPTKLNFNTGGSLKISGFSFSFIFTVVIR